MARNRNENNEPFDDSTIQKVWEKGIIISGEDSSKVRKDKCGTQIKRSLHGDEVIGGWEIDHIYPKAKGGTDDLSNLQPLFWKTNKSKSDTYPWSCP